MARIWFLITVLMVAISVEVTTATPAFACSCIEREAGQMLDDSGAAFIGTLLDDGFDAGHQRGERRTVVFEVEQWVKGSYEDTVALSTEGDSAVCGLAMREGQRAAIFVWESQSQLKTGLCNTTSADSLIEFTADLDLPLASGLMVDPIDPTAAGGSTVRWLAAAAFAVGLGVAAALVMKRRVARPTAESLR